MTQTYLSFTIGESHFAVNVSKVLEVLQKEYITPVPNAPLSVRGIINFRGSVVPVFDTRVRFNMDQDISASYNIVILDISENSGSFLLGAIVDKVEDVITFEDTEINPVPEMGIDYNSYFLQGIYKTNKEFLLLLNAEKVFTTAELRRIQERTVINQ